jgi:hypothetical protein
MQNAEGRMQRENVAGARWEERRIAVRSFAASQALSAF